MYKNYITDMDRQSVPEDWSVLAWGSTSQGQLGIGAIEDEKVLTATVLKQPVGQRVGHIACGRYHTLFAMKDGTVYSCGSNDCGQLGRGNQPLSRPHLITKLEAQVVHSVAAGESHSFAVTQSGHLFGWGSNVFGQLGLGFTDDTHIQTPKLVKALEKLHVLQVSCGNHHTLALTDAGKLFSWGKNANGQLGLGFFTEKVEMPHVLGSLDGLCIKQIASGGEHNCALSVAGSLFCWGKNNLGQLGTGCEKDCKSPTESTTLRSHDVQYVSCGQEHTAVLTLDGGVFTFGAGGYGQLGHNTFNNEPLPKKMFEMMGNTVSQLACGRCHTLMFVASSGQLYACGLGASGQLGTGKVSNHKIPIMVSRHFIGKATTHTDRTANSNTRILHSLYAGGDQVFLFTANPKCSISSIDYRTADEASSIPSWTVDILESYSNFAANDPVPEYVISMANRLFSSTCVLNGSFLKSCDRHINVCYKQSGVDLDYAERFFKKLEELPNIVISKSIIGMIERHVLTSLGLGQSCCVVECVRGLLTLPLCHAFMQPDQHSNMILLYAERVLALRAELATALDHWWSQISENYFTRLVTIFKSAVKYVIFEPSIDLSTNQSYLKSCLEVLKKLYNVNLKKKEAISYELFYIRQLHERVDIAREYHIYTEAKPKGLQSNSLMLCNYPFIFDSTSKAILVHVDAKYQMQTAIHNEVVINLLQLLVPDPNGLHLVLNVSRESLIKDTIAIITHANFKDFKKPLRVVFKGEEAMDAGGVRKEFFLLLMTEILDPVYGMFTYYEESRLIWFNSQSFEGPDMYMLIGVLCGLAIYNSTLIAINFPCALYKKLLKKDITLEDVKELEPQVGRSLQDILDYEGEDFEEAFDLRFEWSVTNFGAVEQVSLLPNEDGRQKMVTQQNKHEFVEAYIRYRFTSSVTGCFDPFFLGFHKVCGGEALQLFHPQELQTLIVGNESYDWELFQKNCQYKNGYNNAHVTIKHFWKVFHNLELEDKKKFLAFLTGSDRIPVMGMNAIPMAIQPVSGADRSLPVAHTCFNLLDLPMYSSEDILRRKLMLAIQHYEGFGLV